MRQNKIAGYSRRTNAFLLKNDDPEQAQQFHDPVCDECWHEGEALFNIDENRVRREADAESGTRVPRQSVSQLDLVDYYWSRSLHAHHAAIAVVRTNVPAGNSLT